jgi:transposase
MYPNYSKALLNLKDVFIKNVIQADSFLKIFIETKPSEQTCPCCGCKTKRVDDYRIQKIDDAPSYGKSVTPVLRKCRYLCSSCGKIFLEHYSFLPSYHRRTRSLAFYVVDLLRQTYSFKQISILTGVSVPTIYSLLDTIHYFPRLSLLMILKAMPLLGNISVSSLILKNTEFWIFFQTALRAIWLNTGETLRERKG